MCKYEGQDPTESRRECQCPGDGVLGSCELPDTDAGNQEHVLESSMYS